MNSKILSFLDERDLHCVLNKFCNEKLGIKAKTIYHERSTKNKGKSEWLHPDMVGFQLTTSNWDNNIIEVCKNFYISKAILYSFELKKSLSMDTLREYYFQAVSNSSWANEGYLVTGYLDETDTELINELNRLVGAFGIGIIKLDILNPKNSTIFLPAKRKDALDGETMNKLSSINPDYKSYIQDITNSLQINKLVATEWDKVEVYEELKKKIELKLNNLKQNDSNSISSNTFNSKPICSNVEKNIPIVNNEAFIDSKHNNVTMSMDKVILRHSRPIKCIIENNEYTSESWRGLIVHIFSVLKDSDKKSFEKYMKITKLFSNAPNYKGMYYHSQLCLFVRPIDANSCYIELQKLLMSYNIDLNKCILYYEYVNEK